MTEATRSTVDPSSEVLGEASASAGRVATWVLSALFAALIAGHILHTAQYGLLAVLLAMAVVESRYGLKRLFFVIVFLTPLIPRLTLTREPHNAVVTPLYISSPPLEVMLLFLFLLWFLRAAQGKAGALAAGRLRSPLLLFFTIAAFSAALASAGRLWTSELPVSGLTPDAIAFRTSPLAPLFPLRALFTFLESFLIYRFVRANFAREELEGIAHALLFSAFVVVSFGLFDFATHDRSSFYRSGNRAISTFSGPGSFGTYLLMAMPIAATLAVTARRRVLRVCACLSLLGGLAMIYLTRSSAVWWAGGTALLLHGLLFFKGPPSLSWTARRVLLLVMLAGVVGAGGFLLATRTTSEINQLTHGRYFFYLAALNMVRTSPLVGVGLGNYYSLLGSFYPEGIVSEKLHTHAHDLYLQLLSELGPAGLIVFLVPFWRLFKRAARAKRLGAMTGAMLLATLGVLLHGLPDYTLYIVSISLLFWTCVATLTTLLESPEAPAAGAPST